LPSAALGVYGTFSVKTFFLQKTSSCFADKTYFKVVTAGNYFDNYGDVLKKIHKTGLSNIHFTFKLFNEFSSNSWARQRKSCYDFELEMT